VVFERLYSSKVLEKNFLYAFILGVAFACIGIGISVILFPQDPAMISIAITSLLFYPTIKSLVNKGENIEAEEDYKLSYFFVDKTNIFKIYLLYFVGVMLVFSFFSIVMPSFAANHLFENQIGILYGDISGSATFTLPLFKAILSNNLIVLFLCFLLAFLIGDVGVLIITWNASVWGTIFGILAKGAAASTSGNPIIYFLLIMVIVITHLIFEIMSYVIAAISGGILSRGLLIEKFSGKRLKVILINVSLLLSVALLVLLFAVIVETFVLDNITLYQSIIQQSL